MADRILTKVITFNAGYATDLAPQVRELTFLDKAENIIYEVNGSARKVGGAAKINSSAITGGPSITGMYDFWTSGTGGTDTQKFVAVTSDGKVWKEDMDGTFDEITGAASISPNAIPVFAQMGDKLSIWFNTNDTPLKYTGTGNVTSLGGTPPVGRGCLIHANRPWAWGMNANASRITYGTSTDIEDWTTDDGSIDIDPDDGDRIIGCASYKETLFIFKGPNKGSIHTITGNTVATFSLKPLTKGIALQSHNSIIPVGDDVWFMSDQGIHSLSATQNFGNFAGAFLSRFLRGYFRSNINRTNLSKVWGVNYAEKGCALWALTASGASTNNTALGISYVRAQEEGLKPFTWTGRTCVSAALRIHPTTKLREVVFGGNDGFARRQDTTARNIDTSTAYSFRAKTPMLEIASTDSQGKPKGDQPVTLQSMYVKSSPVGNYDITVLLNRDQNAAESYTFNQGQAGFILNDATRSILDGTNTLAGGDLQIVYADLTGEARGVRLDVTQGGLDQDAQIYEIGINYVPAADSHSTTL